MKNTFTLFVAILITMASLAIPAQSKLSITVAGHQNLQVVVDNNRYQGDDNSIVINNLQPGHHTVKVYSRRDKRNIWGNVNNIQLIYSSRIYTRPGYLTGIIIDRSGRAVVDERIIRPDRRDDDWGNDRDYGRGNNRHDERNNYDRRPVNGRSFRSIVENLNREYSENSRLVLAKQIIGRNYFTTDQVKHMLILFSFEHHRLELAKYAYRNTTDQRNYFALYDAFSYRNSKEELAEYIRRYR